MPEDTICSRRVVFYIGLKYFLAIWPSERTELMRLQALVPEISLHHTQSLLHLRESSVVLCFKPVERLIRLV